MIGIICGQWEMDFAVDEDQVSTTRIPLDVPWTSEVFSPKHLEEVSSHTTSIAKLIEGLPTGLSVTEFFGGLGIHSTVVQNLLQLSQHVIIEKDNLCWQHLEKNFSKNAQIVHGDSLNLWEKYPADIYMLDWNSWTIHQWDRWRELFMKLLSTEPQAITWFDSSKSYFHMHRERYSNDLNYRIASIVDYALGLSKFFLDRYGYSISRAVYRARGTSFLLQKGEHEVSHIHIPWGSKGFVWKS